VKNDFNSQPGLAALLDQAKSDRQLSAIGVYGYWAVSVSSPIPWLQNTVIPEAMSLARPNRKHSRVGRKSSSLTSLLAPVATLLFPPLLLLPTQRKSTEPPDERRGLPMSSRRIPGLGRRGAAAGGAPAPAPDGSSSFCM